MQTPRSSLAVGALALALTLGSGVSMAFVTVGVSITLSPPELPVYEQPAIPAPGYIWAPGYWAWSEDGYYWVPGTWVLPPRAGLLWTPGYWGWVDGAYVWNPGYWGPHVGFYGGVDYGFGYVGTGFVGGYWDHGTYYYNRAVNNIPADVHITNVYNRTVVNNITVTRVSYNGGSGGIQARPSPAEIAAAREPHVQPVAAQEQQEQAAARNPQLRASANHGRPPIAATARPGAFSGRGVVAAREPAARAQPNGQEPHAPSAASRHEPAGTAHAVAHPGATHAQPQNEFRAIPERHGGGTPAPRQAQPPAKSHPAAKAQPHAGAAREQRRPDEPRC